MVFKGQLEIDPNRGVIYFHSDESGATLLRIQGLPTPIPEPKPGEGLDIQAHNCHTNWLGEKSEFAAKGD